MKAQRFNSFFSTMAVITSTIVVIQSCVKAPTPAFLYEPYGNAEAGDTIRFVNESLDATSFAWDFGDGGTSTYEDPIYIYGSSGSYEISLIATNEKTSNEIIQNIIIKDPTVLGFIVYQDDETTPLPNCEVWVYDNQFDYDRFNDPQFLKLTNEEGLVLFVNLESQEYYMYFFLETETGSWFSAGVSDPLTPNDFTGYNVVCTFIPDETKKSILEKKNALTISSNKPELSQIQNF
jgi:PKD repeat protein